MNNQRKDLSEQFDEKNLSVKINSKLTEYEKFELFDKYQTKLSDLKDMKAADERSYVESESDLLDLQMCYVKFQRNLVYAKRYSVACLFMWGLFIFFTILGSVLLCVGRNDLSTSGLLILVTASPILFFLAMVCVGIISAYDIHVSRRKALCVVGRVCFYIVTGGVYGLVISISTLKYSADYIENEYQDQLDLKNREIESKKRRLRDRDKEIEQYSKLIEMLTK